MPDSMKAKPTKGTCRWCAKPIVKPDNSPDTRKTWHPQCVVDYKIARFSDDQRRAVYARDKGVCARCQKDTDAERTARYGRNLSYHNTGHLWQADHILPLIEAKGRLEYFTLANLQTLCTPCHVVKGREDNARRKLANQPTLL